MNIQGAGLDLLRNAGKFFQSSGTAVTKTTQAAKAPFVQKPKKEKDLFLEGFYSVADKPKEERRSYTSPLAKSRAILDSISQTKPAKRVVEEEEDDFLKGFYSVADRPKAETPISAQPQTTYKPGDWIRSTMAQPNLWNAKNTDLSPQKVNYASQTDNAQIADNISTVTKGIGSGLHTNPLTGTPYKIIDRYEVYDRYKNMPQYINKNGKSILQKPDGRFGITLRESPEITQKTRIPRVNAAYRLDNPHQGVNYPHQNINYRLVKDHNNAQIDAIAKHITLQNDTSNPLFADVAQNQKIRNSKFIDDVSYSDELISAGNNMDEFKYNHKKISKGLLDAAENYPQLTKVVKLGGKTVGVVGTAIDLAEIGGAVYRDIADDNDIVSKETVSTTARVVGESAGAFLGAKGGAALGAWIFGAAAGLVSGGLLAAPAAALGGAIGGLVGGMAGSYILGSGGEHIVNAVWD